jgi:hypothetical protein
MSIASFFIHSVDIRRFSETSEDAHGLGVDSGSLVGEGVPCRKVTQKEKVHRDEDGVSTVVTVEKFLLPAGTDVQARDQLEGLTLEDGSSVSGTFEVVDPPTTKRARAEHHVSVEVERVS